MTDDYWAYVTAEEARRAFALDMATRGSYFSTEDEAIVRARRFEAYLKGESA